jgi:glycosyltransferase involved in cell wall biosynthesis
VVPHDTVPHAGGVYLQHLHRCLVTLGCEVTFIIQDTELERVAAALPGAPERVLFVGAPGSRKVWERAIMRAAREIERFLWHKNPTWPPFRMIVGLLLSEPARVAVRAADVVDLQWPEFARLVPLVRFLNPRVRIVTTLHDVLSQRWARRATRPESHESAAVRRAERSARRLEHATVRWADSVVVFSEKDRDLLLDSCPDRVTAVEVLPPPLAALEQTRRSPSRVEPTVVFVGLLSRPENDDAALWLVQQIWPLVHQEFSTARLRLVGQGASERLTQATARGNRIELAGFVDDLGFEYATAAVCVVPLRLGAGVKFKTVEALVAGVPTVTTSVGAEGIAGADQFAALADDAEGLAAGIIGALRHPDVAERAASEAQSWARTRYDESRFAAEIGRIYGVIA